MEVVSGTITNFDERGITIFVPLSAINVDRAVLRRYRDVLVGFTDGRKISTEQRKKAHALIQEIADWMGDVADYIKTMSVPKLLFYAMYITKFPVALKTKWFSDLLRCLNKHRSENDRYVFPEHWLPEKQVYAVHGARMSFGENRRGKNWREIESTFYMQLLRLVI